MAYIEERRSRDGKVTFRAQVRLKGHPQQDATFDRKTDAKRWAQQTEAAIREGRHFKTTEAKRRTVAEMIDRYGRDVLDNKGGNAEKSRRLLAWWKDELGAYSLADLTPALIAEHRDKLAAGTTPRGNRRTSSTVVRYLAALSHCLSTAVREWGWMDDSPMRKVTKPTQPRGRVRFLSEAERGRLLEACRSSTDRALHPMVLLAIATGMRQGEIVGLVWDAVDFKRGVITLDKTKNGERRVLPISDALRPVLEEWSKVRRIDSPLVFPPAKAAGPRFPRAAWERAIDESKVENFTFHDLRHTAASYLAMSGASLIEIADVLGHKTLAMVRRYAHLSQPHTASVVARMNAAVLGGTP